MAEPQDLNTALREAYEKHETATDEQTPVEDVSEESTGGDADSGTEAAAPEPPEDTSSEAAPEPDAAPESGESEPAELPAPEGEQAPEPRVDTEVNLAPAAWRGSAKQHWGDLPTEVQEEVLRREKETNQVLNDTAQARQFTDRFMEVAAPYQGIFQSERVDPLSAAQSLFQTAAELRQGTAEQKAGIVFRLMKQHGIDEQLLDKMLVGEMQAPAGGAVAGQPALDPAVQAVIDQQIQPLKELTNRLLSNEAAQGEALVAEMDAEIEQFAADPQHVFFADVTPVMAELFEAADRAGRPLDLETAYKTAVSMDPQLRDLQAKRDAALRANSTQSASARRERAAASLKPTSVPDNTPSTPTDRESQLLAAWDMHSGR